MSEHGEEPRNGVEVGHKAELGKVIAHQGVVKRGDDLKQCKILLDGSRVVLLKETVQVLFDEEVKTRKRLRFVVEVENHKWSCERVQPLPVDFAVGLVEGEPCLQDASQLAVTFRGSEQIIVLVTSRYVHRYLPVSGCAADFVDPLVQ